jgi:hypothetical protein
MSITSTNSSVQSEKTPLPTTVDQALEYATRTDRIVPWAKFGEQIPLLCQHGAGFSTKNEYRIGSNSLHVTDGSCSSTEACKYQVVVPDDWQQKVTPLEMRKCTKCSDGSYEECNVYNSTYCVSCRV